MLGKLLKHDIIATWKVPVALDAVLIVLGVLTALMMNTVNYVGDSFGMSIFMFSFIGLFYIGIIAANVVTLIYLVVRYYRSMYTSEGYLTFTLPVKTDMIVHSKVITGALWLFLSYLFTFISLLIAGMGFIKKANISLVDIREGFSIISDIMGFSEPGFMPVIIITILITPIAGILCMYFSVSVGQLWQSHKILGSVLCIIALYIINQLLSQIAFLGSGFWEMMGASGADIDATFGHVYKKMMMILSIITAIQAAVYYAVCLIINRKQINLD
jgi:hypothetical protein